MPDIAVLEEVNLALALSITQADGRVYRWGGDEPNAGDVPQGLNFGTAIPGGHKDLSCSLARRIDIDYPDQQLFDNVRAYGPGNETAWEGRQAQFPRSHGDSFSIAVGAVGHSAHLKDDPSFREIYVDRDLARWGPMSVQRRINQLATYTPADASVLPDTATGQPSLAQAFQGAWPASPGLPLSEAWYDAGAGLALGDLYYAWKHGPNIVLPQASWHWNAALVQDDIDTARDITAELRAAGPGTGTITATTTNRRYARLQLYYDAAGGSAGLEYSLYWTCPAVYGTHGLTKRGTASATHAQGLYASDVIADIVGRAAPLLNYTTGPGGSIQPTTFEIPHLAFPDPTTAEDAVLRTNVFHLYEWGVYDSKTFFFRPPDDTSPGRPNQVTWETRLGDGAHLDLEGDQADDVYNGVIVRYPDVDGTTKTVGPPGSGFDTEDASLADTSADNPVNAHGIPRRWAILEMSQTATAAGAIQIGAVYLAEKSLPARRGTIVVSGTVRHPTAGLKPVWAIRAGDHVVVRDHPVSVPRRIIETRYSHDGVPSNTLTVDNGSLKLDAILERIGVNLVGVI